MRIAGEKMGDRDENHSAKGCGSKRVPKAEAVNVELYENPATDEGTDQAKNNIGDAAEAAAARDLPREPSCDEANQEPADDAVSVLENEDLRIGQKR